MKVLLTGAGGQLGRALRESPPPSVQLTALGHGELDIASPEAVRAQVERIQPDCIINAAAYTAVDAAESDPGSAMRGNQSGPATLAAVAMDRPGMRVVHLSTDYVFDGQSATPYAPDSPVAPLGVYGRSKLAGEQALLQALGARAVVLRTAWLYAASGRNFLLTMLRLMRERGQVGVVSDQIGAPTSVRPLAEVVWGFVARPQVGGTYHWSDAGVASWYDFAVAIAEEGLARGLLPSAPQVRPILTSDYPTPARRPQFSLLDKRRTVEALGIEPKHWRARLREVLDEISNG